MDDPQKYFDANQSLWDKRTLIHKNSSFYDMAGFKSGKDVLTAIELKEIGDVTGKKLLHLQCHFGLDTLNWCRMGATCVGLDFSQEAINLARELNDELRLDARFVCCNLLDTAAFVKENFDIVFTSYGTVGWLPELEPWARIINERLKPGGFFYMAEFHPVVWMFDDEFTQIKYHYDNRETIVQEDQPTYTGDTDPISGKEFSWNHSLSEVINALIGAGLKIEFFNEHMYSPYPNFRNTIETEPGKWHIKGMEGKIPMVYSLKASKI